MPRIAELAMQAAILERGVGMIILLSDVSAALIEHPMLEHPIATERSRVRPFDQDLDRVADLIAKSERIAIFGDAGCLDARAGVLQLSQLLNAPVGFTFRGKDILECNVSILTPRLERRMGRLISLCSFERGGWDSEMCSESPTRIGGRPKGSGKKAR
jgi:thiamine pyrophosphate-dependent acetolactate synthase large subunit-like protein